MSAEGQLHETVQGASAKLRAARKHGVGFAAALACLAVSLAVLALPEAVAAREKQPARAAYPASCTTPWGARIAHGKTAQGFCVDHQRSRAVCGLTKLCNNGQWVPK